MLRIAICDDDVKFCELIKKMLENYLQTIHADFDIRIYLTGESLCFDYYELNFDLIFLDIELTGINGVGIGQMLRQQSQNVQIVYVSSKEEYAMQLFQNRPFDFLVKPVTKQRFNVLLDTYFQVFPIADRYFQFVTDRCKKQIAVKEIVYFESIRKQLRIVTEKQEILFYAKLTDVLNEPFSKQFLRIHQSFLVNTQYISEFRYGEVKLSTGSLLPISRGYQDTVREFLIQREQKRMLQEVGYDN